MIRRYTTAGGSAAGAGAGGGVVIHERADGARLAAGYAAVFYSGVNGSEYTLWDDRYGRAVERIMPGAFDAALSRPDDVRGLFNHNANLLLGRTASGTMALSVDRTGLRYEITLGNSTTAADLMDYLARGDVTGSSFSFSIPPGGERWIVTQGEDGRQIEVREILAVSLFDVGPVTFPAYGATTAKLRDDQPVYVPPVRGTAPRGLTAGERADCLARVREIDLAAAGEALKYKARARAVQIEVAEAAESERFKIRARARVVQIDNQLARA